MKKQVTMILAATVAMASAGAVQASDMPEWLNGDYRARIQQSKWDTTTGKTITQFRHRFRLNGTADVNADTKVNFGIATLGDSRSTNFTSDQSFMPATAAIDHMYITHSINDNMSLKVGRMANPFYTASQYVWDNDVRPEGAAVQYSKQQSSDMGIFVNAGFFALDEDPTAEKDPTMIVVQPGATYSMSNGMEAKGAVGIYMTQNLKDWATYPNNSNVGTDEPMLLSLTGEVSKDNVMGLDSAKVYGEISNNSGADSGNKGGLVGVTAGSKKVTSKGDWQVGAAYALTPADAVFGFLTDADVESQSGNTNVDSMQLTAAYACGNNKSVNFKFFNNKDRSSEKKQTKFQLDMNVKF